MVSGNILTEKLTELLLETKKPIENTKEIKVVLDRNGYERARLDENEDYNGRVVTLGIPDGDYKYLREHYSKIEEPHVEKIFKNAL